MSEDAKLFWVLIGAGLVIVAIADGGRDQSLSLSKLSQIEETLNRVETKIDRVDSELEQLKRQPHKEPGVVAE